MARTIRDSWGNEHGPRRNLEGPFKRPDGSVVYYDPRYQGGRYWDPLSDMYLDRDVDPFRRAASVIDPAMFDKLRPGQRLWMTVSSGMQSGEKEFEVGRTTFSKKYNVYSKQLFPVENGVPLKRGRAKWVMFKRDSGVSVSHGGMGTVVKNIRVASGDEELRSNLIRLAHANPELRPKLLPLLKMASEQKEAGRGSAYRPLLEGGKTDAVVSIQDVQKLVQAHAREFPFDVKELNWSTFKFFDDGGSIKWTVHRQGREQDNSYNPKNPNYVYGYLFHYPFMRGNKVEINSFLDVKFW